MLGLFLRTSIWKFIGVVSSYLTMLGDAALLQLLVPFLTIGVLLLIV